MGGQPGGRGRILVVGDGNGEALRVATDLRGWGYDLSTSRCGDAAIVAIEQAPPDVVLLFACGPGTAGLRTLARSRALAPGSRFLILAFDEAVDTAVAAMRMGADDYVRTPVNVASLAVRIDRALEERRLRRDLPRGRRDGLEATGLRRPMVGASAVMRTLLDRIERVAATDVPVLVTGETGSGKELVASAIHDLSSRHNRELVLVSCSALPEALLESELFGHAKGAFTGAVANRRGLLEEASGGTAFLDEIETLSLGMQAKLLRAADERTVQRVGGRHDVPVDFRLVASTNVPLERMVERGEFREDLFFRLNVFPIRVPALRERRGDIPLLAAHFRDQFARRTGLLPLDFESESLERMAGYAWPGNVRELRYAVERSMILSSGRGRLHVVLPDGAEAASDPELARALEQGWSLRRLEDTYIAAALRHVDGNRSQAARLLGIDRRTLYRRLRQEDARG